MPAWSSSSPGRALRCAQHSELTDGELRQTLRQISDRLGDIDRRLANLEAANRSEIGDLSG